MGVHERVHSVLGADGQAGLQVCCTSEGHGPVLRPQRPQYPAAGHCGVPCIPGWSRRGPSKNSAVPCGTTTDSCNLQPVVGRDRRRARAENFHDTRPRFAAIQHLASVGVSEALFLGMAFGRWPVRVHEFRYCVPAIAPLENRCKPHLECLALSWADASNPRLRKSCALCCRCADQFARVWRHQWE